MLVIDAYNVLHLTGSLPADLAGLEPDEFALLLASSRYAGDRILLVCDGSEAGWARGARRAGIGVWFAGPGKDADGLIEAILDRHRSLGKLLTVVSSDHRLKKAARRAGARSLASETLLQRLAADWSAADRRSARADAVEKTPVPLPATAVREWIEQFGVGSWSPPETHADDLPPALRSLPTHTQTPSAASPTRDLQADAGRPGSHPDRADSSRATPASPAQPPAPREAHMRQAARERRLAALMNDPQIAEALRIWSGRLDLDDLDMAKWLGE